MSNILLAGFTVGTKVEITDGLYRGHKATVHLLSEYTYSERPIGCIFSDDSAFKKYFRDTVVWFSPNQIRIQN